MTERAIALLYFLYFVIQDPCNLKEHSGLQGEEQEEEEEAKRKRKDLRDWNTKFRG